MKSLVMFTFLFYCTVFFYILVRHSVSQYSSDQSVRCMEKRKEVRDLFNRKYGTTNLLIFEFVSVKISNF